MIVDFPISPSELPWWGWMLCTVGTVIIGVIAVLINKVHDNLATVTLIAVSWIVAAILFLITIIRFVKWIWIG
jgi:undecaprenyl pyrophosphate phosphatase UppP